MRAILVTGFIIAWLFGSVARAEEMPSATPSPTPAPQAPAAPEGASTPEDQRPVKIPEMPEDSKKSAAIAYFLRSHDAGKRIAELELSDSEAPVVLVAKGDDIKPTIAIHGTYRAPGWKLSVQEEAPALPESFTVYAHLRGRLNEITFLAKGPNGEKKTEKIYIYAPNARTFHVVSAWDDLLFSAGFANFSYAQTGFGTYESLNLAASIRYGSPDTDDFVKFVASAEMTVLALAATPIDTAPQLFEAKGDFSFRTNKQPMRRTRHRILVGGTYLTMFRNGSPFGFSDLAAFEVGLQSRYIASPKTDWIAEIRYMPIGGLAALGQQGVNLIVAWSRLLENSHRMEVALTYSAYNYNPADQIAIETSLFTLRTGLTF